MPTILSAFSTYLNIAAASTKYGLEICTFDKVQPLTFGLAIVVER